MATTPTKSLSATIRDLLVADPNLSSDDVLKRVRSKGYDQADHVVKQNTYNVKSQLKREGETDTEASEAKLATPTGSKRSRPEPVRITDSALFRDTNANTVPVPNANPITVPFPFQAGAGAGSGGDLGQVLVEIAELVDRVGGPDAARDLVRVVERAGGPVGFLALVGAVEHIRTKG